MSVIVKCEKYTTSNSEKGNKSNNICCPKPCPKPSCPRQTVLCCSPPPPCSPCPMVKIVPCQTALVRYSMVQGGYIWSGIAGVPCIPQQCPPPPCPTNALYYCSPSSYSYCS